MRLWISFLILCCCAVTGYSQDIAASEEGNEVAVGVDAKGHEKPGGCGCGKPKPKG